MKRLFLLLFAVICLLSVCGCSSETWEKDGKIHIVAATFPAYDFARAVVGENGTVVMLLSPGEEVHSFDPSPRDIRKIQTCDFFVYTGGESDTWTEGVLDTLPDTVTTFAMINCVPLLEEAEALEGEEEETDDEEDVEYDEHVWTSLANAQLICSQISEELCRISPENAEIFTQNAQNYIAEIAELENAFAEVVKAGNRKTLVFADRFPFLYFAQEFGLEVIAAFPGCVEETEPGAQTIATLIDRVQTEKIPVVMTIEFSNGRLADTVCEATGAKRCEFHSAHNVTRTDFEAGVTYVDLMKRNLTVLQEALQ